MEWLDHGGFGGIQGRGKEIRYQNAEIRIEYFFTTEISEDAEEKGEEFFDGMEKSVCGLVVFGVSENG